MKPMVSGSFWAAAGRARMLAAAAAVSARVSILGSMACPFLVRILLRESECGAEARRAVEPDEHRVAGDHGEHDDRDDVGQRRHQLARNVHAEGLDRELE